MEKPSPAHESAPPYPDQPVTYGGPMPGPGMYSQPGPYPGAPPPPGYQEVVMPPPGMNPHPPPGFPAGPPPHAGYHTVPQPGMYPQPGYPPGPPQPGYPPGPPQPGYPPGPPHPAGHQGAYFVPVLAQPVTCYLRDHPGNMVCPHCQQTVLTNTTATPGILTWISCFIIAIVGCFCFCWIPFLIDSCQDIEHRCPTCQRVIHIYRRNESYGFGRRVVVTRAYL